MKQGPHRQLRRVQPGQEIRAEHINQIVEALEGEASGWRELETAAGSHRALERHWTDWRWGRLDEKLDASDPLVSATFSEWELTDSGWQDTGRNVEVYPGFDAYRWYDVWGPKHPGRAVRGREGKYYFLPRYEIWRFELKEDLTQWTTLPTAACRKDWDPSANGGWGGFVINASVQFNVFDWRKVGYYGVAGAEGAAEIRYADGTDPNDKGVLVGVIVDLECPTECICGSQDPNWTIECS